MKPPEHVIPWDRLPRGFAERVDTPPAEPVEAKPAATVVLLREQDARVEALLLRRHARSGFVPGAGVFPGGRLDPGDALPAYWEGDSVRPAVPDAPFWVAAVREAFEETGVLLAGPGEPADPARLTHWRERLLADEATLVDVLNDVRLRLSLSDVVHIAHWITPVIEPRRYDTHFFMAALPPGRVIEPDAREMTDALWLPPAAALERHARGALPMVFPTVKVLEQLAGFDGLREMFATLRGRRVDPIMPRLVRTPEGLGFVLESEGTT